MAESTAEVVDLIVRFANGIYVTEREWQHAAGDDAVALIHSLRKLATSRTPGLPSPGSSDDGRDCSSSLIMTQAHDASTEADALRSEVATLKAELAVAREERADFVSAIGNITEVVRAVARGELSRRIMLPQKGLELLVELKDELNSMVGGLSVFAEQVTRVANNVGVRGVLGDQAELKDVQGIWRELTDSVNEMAFNLTAQVRSIAEVTRAVAAGDLAKKIEVHAQGEIRDLKETINSMIDRLSVFVFEVSRVAIEVGTEGKLGVQAEVRDVDGVWSSIITHVNTLASNLTSQVRAFGTIAAAANAGDFSAVAATTVEASGEMGRLKSRLDEMVLNLQQSLAKNVAARETAELANRAKSMFLANTSHEVRTPLHGIMGLTNLTLDTQLTRAQRENLMIVANLAASLLNILDSVLDLSKVEAGAMQVEDVAFSLRSQVFDIMKSLYAKCTEKGLELLYEVDHGIPDQIVGDPLRIRQVILNLISNSVKFTSHGHIALSVKLVSAREDGVNIRIIVEDTGIGIAADKTELIFDTFTQADGSTTRQYGGTGLGLSISRRLARLLGGDLRVESELGHGASFLFDVPVKFDGSGESDKMHAKMSPYRGVGVLYIASQQENKALIQTLKDLGLEPHSFTRPVDAVACKERLDRSGVAIVDSMLTARAARGIASLKTVPLVLLTNDSERLDISRCLELGITSYGSLPASHSSIVNALIPALETRGASPSYDTSVRFKILLAEDNVINQRVAVKLLEKFKHTIEVVENGLMAVEAIQAGRVYDLILMDLQMPTCGGIEATQRIRQWEASTCGARRLPIIALTAHAMLGDREKCLEAGMDDVVTKPIKMDTLIQTINKCATLGTLVPGNMVSCTDPLRLSPNKTDLDDRTLKVVHEAAVRLKSPVSGSGSGFAFGPGAGSENELTMPEDAQLAAADRPFGKRTISTPGDVGEA